MSRKCFPSAPPQQHPRKPFYNRHQRTQHEMHDTERSGQHEAKSVGKIAEKHFGKQVEQDIKKEYGERENRNKTPHVTTQRFMKNHRQPTEDDEVRDGVPHQNRPKKVFRMFKVIVQDL